MLIDSAGYNFAAADRPLMLRLIGSPLLPLVDRLPVRRAFTRLALRQVFHDDTKVSDERVEEYAAPFLRPGAVRSMGSLLSSLDGRTAGALFTPAVARLRSRTLIVWGREDAWIPVEHADRFAAAIPGARKVVIETCGHLPQEEKPAEVIALLRLFLSESGG